MFGKKKRTEIPKTGVGVLSKNADGTASFRALSRDSTDEELWLAADLLLKPHHIHLTANWRYCPRCYATGFVGGIEALLISKSAPMLCGCGVRNSNVADSYGYCTTGFCWGASSHAQSEEDELAAKAAWNALTVTERRAKLTEYLTTGIVSNPTGYYYSPNDWTPLAEFPAADTTK